MADLSVGTGRCYIQKRDVAVQTLPLYTPIRLPDTVSTCTQTDETWLPYYGITSPPPKRPPTLSHLAGVSNEQHNSTSTPANSRLGPPVVIGKGSDLSAKTALDLTEEDQANVPNIVLGKPKPTQTSAPPPKVHSVPQLVTQSLWDIPHPNPICLPPRPVKGSWSGTPSWSSSSAVPLSALPPPPPTTPDPSTKPKKPSGPPPSEPGWTILCYHQGQQVWFDTVAWYTTLKKTKDSTGHSAMLFGDPTGNSA